MRQSPRYTVVLAVAALAASLPASAQIVWEVNRADDIAEYRCPSTDRCTLRGAVAVARDEDAIFFSPSLAMPIVIELQQTLVVDKDIEIAGPGPGSGSDRVTLRPAGPFRPLLIRPGADSSARVMLTDLTIRDGVVMGDAGVDGSAPGAHGGSGADALGGCLLVDGESGSASATLNRVAVRDCSVVGGDGGKGAAGLDADRGAGGTGGNGGSGGDALGAAIAVRRTASLLLIQTSVSDSFAIGGRGGNGGRGGAGSLAGGAGGAGGRGGSAAGGAIHADSAILSSAVYVENGSLLANGLGAGDGGAGGAGGRSTGFGGNGAAGQHAPGGDVAGGNLYTGPSTMLELVHATLGPASLVRGNPGNWDGVTETGRGSAQGEVLVAWNWRVRTSALIGTSPHSLCGGTTPQSWNGSGSSAASSDLCLQDESLHAGAGSFVAGMAAMPEQGRAAAIPLRNSRLVDATGACGATYDQSGRLRPLDGDGDGVAACDIGAIEVAYSVQIFADGFGD